MNYKISFKFGGGIFSYMGILLENLTQWDKNGLINDTDTIYVDNRNLKDRTVLSQTNINFFDLLLDQDETTTGNLTSTEIHPVYLHEFNDKKEDYKKISKKYLRLNKDVKAKFEEFVDENFTDKTLGVHVRMTDMNHHHPYLGQVKNQHYLDMISKVMGENDFTKIFVASDNYETIEILKREYGDMIIHYDTDFRFDKSDFDSFDFTKNNWIMKPQFYIDSFMDGLLLSKCNATIGRTSLLNWTSQSFHWGNIENYYHIDGDTSHIKDPNMK